MSWYEPAPTPNLCANTKLRYIIRTNKTTSQTANTGHPTTTKTPKKRSSKEDQRNSDTKKKRQPIKKVSTPKKKNKSEKIDETNFI